MPTEKKTEKKVRTNESVRKEALGRMLEHLINDRVEEAALAVSECINIKTREIVLGEQNQSQAFSMSGTVMDDDVKGTVKYENGGKKTLKKHDNSAPGLDDDSIDKTKFKSGGKQPAKTLEKTPKPVKFNDGRSKELGTTKK